MATPAAPAVPPPPDHPPTVPSEASADTPTAPGPTPASVAGAASPDPAPEPGTDAPSSGLARALAPVQPARSILGSTADLDPKDGAADPASAETGKTTGKNAAGADGKDDSRDGPIGALVRALAQRLGRTGTATTIKKSHDVKETRVSGSSTNTTNAHKSDRLAKNEHAAQHRSQRDAKTADLNNKTHQHQGKDNRDVRKADSTDAKTAASKASKADTASKTGKDSRDSNSNDTKSADTKASKNDTASKTGKDSRDSNSNDTKSADTKSSKNDTASKTGKDSRDSNSNDTKSADTKSSKNDTASKTGKDDKHHSDEKTSKGPDSKTAGPTAPKGGKDDGKDDGGAKTPKPDGSAGDGGAAKADPGSVKPGGGPKPDDNGPAPGGAAPGGGSTPGGPVGPGGTRGADPADAKGADTKFRGAKVSGLVGAAPEPAAPQTPPDRKGPDDKFRKPKTAPAGPVKPGAAGPKPAPAGCAPANPETKATPTSANGPATRDGRTTMNDPSNAAAGMVPVSGSTADLANEPPAAPAAGPVIAPSPTRIPAQAGSPDAAATAEPVQHVHAGADSVTFAAPDGAGHTMSRGEVRTLKQFERRLAAKGQVLAKVAEGSKDIRATAVDQATRAQRLAEDAKQVKGGDRLVAMAQRLAERVQTLRAKAEQTEKGAERGTEAVKALASNAEKRHGVIYKAVVDSPLTSPAEREFYQDKEGS